VSPDGRIAQRDVGSKLVVVMVGLPARGKSYIVKKIARYLNWMQHDCKIFNVGNLRRIAAGGGQTQTDTSLEGKLRASVHRLSLTQGGPPSILDHKDMLPPPAITTQIMINGEAQNTVEDGDVSPCEGLQRQPSQPLPAPEQMEQDASFFDPENAKALQIREQVALETLDELLDYVLNQGGSVGILDATNSTLERRKTIMNHIRERAGTELNVLFLESLCVDENLLESNMRLKLSGPDYKDKDPTEALADFKKRVKMYEKKYVPLGDYEEHHNMPYMQMIDVGRKFVSHQIRGFLQIILSTYLLNFNLAPRQIWLTRHGESMDNVNGKIGGDSSLSPAGVRYAKALARFIGNERAAWERRQVEKQLNTHWPPRPGDTTPPNPEYNNQTADGEKNFCIWTSMLKRSIETAQFFSEEDYDIKQMRMLDELNAGDMEGMTYDEIKVKFANQYALRKLDKLHYRYPGPGGEGYLDIINRLQKVIIEVERMTDHVLLVGHRSITRVLLAYFKGLGREDISDLDVPLGVAYMLEPVSVVHKCWIGIC
jgi:6-phosphofructo-2-kinase